MATFKSVSALAVHQKQRAKKARRSLEVGSKAVADEMKAEALRLTSGTVSTETLARMGHPFARRRTGTRRRGGQRGSLSRLPINRQTGKLQKSLRVFRQVRVNGITWRLQFTAAHAKFVLAPGGTRTTVARGFWAAMRKHYDGKVKRQLIRAWRMAHK